VDLSAQDPGRPTVRREIRQLALRLAAEIASVVKRARLLIERYDPLIELTVVDEKEHRTAISVRHAMAPAAPGQGHQ
jgi:hypothetical protein